MYEISYLENIYNIFHAQILNTGNFVGHEQANSKFVQKILNYLTIIWLVFLVFEYVQERSKNGDSLFLKLPD